jgi:hypothetical protein
VAVFDPSRHVAMSSRRDVAASSLSRRNQSKFLGEIAGTASIGEIRSLLYNIPLDERR